MKKPKENLNPNVSVFKHRYKWSNEERWTIGVLAVLSVAAVIVSAFNSWTPGWLIIGAFCLGFALYAFYIGNKRKTESTMTVVYNNKDTTLMVDGNKYEGRYNTIDLREVGSVGVKQLGSKQEPGVFTPKDLLVFRPHDKGRSTMLPLRTLSSNPDLAKIVKMLIDASGNEESLAAYEFGVNYKG